MFWARQNGRLAWNDLCTICTLFVLYTGVTFVTFTCYLLGDYDMTSIILFNVNLSFVLEWNFPFSDVTQIACKKYNGVIQSLISNKTCQPYSWISPVVLWCKSSVGRVFENKGARCNSVVRAFAHGAMGRRIDPSWGGPIELFLVPASAPLLV